MNGTEKAKLRLTGFYNKRGKVTLQVADNGPGILPDVLDKIFIPFLQLSQMVLELDFHCRGKL